MDLIIFTLENIAKNHTFYKIKFFEGHGKGCNALIHPILQIGCKTDEKMGRSKKYSGVGIY